MARVYAKTVFIPVRSGAGTQTITGVRDPVSGRLITTKAYIVHGSATLNTLEQYMRVSTGFGAGSVHRGSAAVDFEAFSAKIAQNVSSSSASVLAATEAFTGTSRSGYLDNIVAGGFDLVLTINDFTGDTLVITVLDGDDLDVAVGHDSSGSVTTSFAPDVAFFGRIAASVVASFGWATRTSGQAAIAGVCNNQGDNAVYQRSDKAVALLSSVTLGVDYESAVSDWLSNGFTMAAGAGSDYLALGGVSHSSGIETQPDSGVTQILETGIKPRLILFISDGKVAGTSVVSGAGFSWSNGSYDGEDQHAYWTGETTIGNVTPIKGARKLSNSDALLFADANGASTAILARAQVTGWDVRTGQVSVYWPVSDGVARSYAWLAIGEPVGADLPIAYEDPCSITQPRVYMKVTTETETFKMSVSPMRESAAQGGFGVPRLIGVGPITKSASDPFTGGLSAQTASMRNADTDRVLRAASATRTSFRGCNAEIYLTSKAQSVAGLPPRVLLAGVVYSNSHDENLVQGFDLNDPIGAGYSVTGEDVKLIRRRIPISHFPNCPPANVGLPEQFVIGRRAPLVPSKGEGVVLGITVGNINVGGTSVPPAKLHFDDLVAALQASKDAGTLDADFGSWFGHGDLASLAAYGGSVPGDLDRLADGRYFDGSLAPFEGLGYVDIDYYLNNAAKTGGGTYLMVLVSCAAISEVLDGQNGNPSIWIDDTQIDPAQLGVSVWCPQIPGYEAHWSAISADLFLDITGSDGVTRRYTPVLFDPSSTYGTQVAGGARVHLDCIGAEDVGDGTGEPFDDYFDCYRQTFEQFGLQTYLSGPWLSPPQFLFSDGTTLIDRVNADSFVTASNVWKLTLPAGLKMSATFSDESVRDFIQRANVCGGCQFANDDFGRYFVKVLDRRRSQFFKTPDGSTHRTLRDKVDVLPGFHVEPKPDWHMNTLTMQYGRNEFTGAYDRDDTGGAIPIRNAASVTLHGTLPLSREYPYLADDASSSAVGTAFVAMFGSMPYVAVYSRRGLCGLEDDLLQGVPVTHYNGFGPNGFQDFGVWPFYRSFQSQMYCSFQALCVDALLDAEEEPLPRVVADYPVNAAILVDADTGFVLVNGA